jgi:hypothetical protein
MPNTFPTFARSAVLCTCVLAAAPAHAQSSSQGAVQYTCGGIGLDESTAMRAAMKDHPLSLLFAQADGSYTAEADVTIKDANGVTTLAMRASGPVCLIDLPAGHYTIEAVAEGMSRKQRVSVGGGPKSASFRF